MSLSASSGEKTVGWNTFLRDVNREREETLAAPWTQEEQERFLSYLPEDPEENGLLSQSELEALTIPHNLSSSLSPQEACSDVDLLFRLLKTTYGAYDFLGGDEVFLPIRDKLTENLGRDGSLDGNTLGVLLWNALSPRIADAHFKKNGASVLNGRNMHTYFVPGIALSPDDNTDWTLAKPTVGPDGSLCWAYTALRRDGEYLPKSVLLNGKEISLDWTEMRPTGAISPIYSDDLRPDGIPLIISRSLIYSEENLPDLNRMAASGAAFSGEPVIIVDLRGNGGGNSGYAQAWVQNFAGREIRRKLLYAQKRSAALSAFLNGETVELEYSPDYIRSMDSVWGTWTSGTVGGAVAPHEGTVFVLVNGSVGSAGEDFLLLLRTVENVVVVGSNTSGTGICGNVCYSFCLPHSGVSVGFGTKLNFSETLENHDGTGFFPDLWVNPDDALDAVLRLCARYGLSPSGTR